MALVQFANFSSFTTPPACALGFCQLSRFCKFGRLESIAHPVHGLNPARLVGVALDLMAQAGNMVIDGAGRRESRVTPDDIEKALARDRLARRPGQQPEHGEFLGREMQRLSSAPASRPLTRSSTCPLAVSMRIGTALPRRRSSAQTE